MGGLWNVSEERVINAQFNFTTTPFNARSSRFQGVPPILGQWHPDSQVAQV